MNPVEIYQFFTALIRDGAEVLAAAAISLCIGVFVGWRFASWWGKGKIEDLTAKKDDLTTQLLKARDEIDNQERTLRALSGQVDGLKSQMTDVKRRLAKAIQEKRDYEASVKRVFDKAVKKKVEPLQQELDTLHAEHVTCPIRLNQEQTLTQRQAEEIRLLEHQLGDLQEVNGNLEQRLIEGTDALRGEQRRYRNACKRARQLQVRLRGIAPQGGKIWERPVPHDAPQFIPLGEQRRCRVISVLNLKGGVGKTTITLNLAACFADRGNRVLMVDCDHQRSLSALCFPLARRRELHDSGLTLQRFLAEPKPDAKAFLTCVQQLQNMPSCSVLVNTVSGRAEDEQGLATVEDRLMLEWLASDQSRDIRLALRQALHSKEVSQHFHYAFLDCPPRLSTATINAIAASDFILIPVVLDAVSTTNPLPSLLESLRHLHTECLFPNFRLLGIVANRVTTRNGEPVSYQRPIWADTPTRAKEAWGASVFCFSHKIPDAAAAYAKAVNGPITDFQNAVATWATLPTRPVFENLTDEILTRITHEAQHPSTVHY